MRISIIIVNYNAQSHLLRCLESINNNTQNIDFEIIVIDNNSRDKSVALLKNHLKAVRLIENKANLGFAKAVNQGVRQAEGEYLLLLNNDTVVLPESINKLIKFMDSRPKIPICGGKVLNCDGSTQFSCRGFPNYLTALFNRGSLLTRIFRNNKFSRNYLLSDWPHDEIREVDWVSACYLIMRKAVAEKLEFFDEQFFMYCEDVDFCFRAKQIGLKVYYFPNAEIIHYSDNSLKKDFRKIIWHHQSMYKFYKKHYSRLWIMDILVAAALTLRATFLLIINCLG